MDRPTYNSDLFPHWTTLKVRFRDLDPLNHVNNAIFSTFYEEARIKFIQELPAFADQLGQSFSFVLANINIDYVLPVTYPAELLVGSGITRLGNSSISSFQAIYRKKDQKLVSVAEASGVWFNIEKQRPTRLPKIENTDAVMVNRELLD